MQRAVQPLQALLVKVLFAVAWCWTSGSAQEKYFRAPVFDYNWLHDLDAYQKDRLSTALRTQGFLSLVHIPGYEEAETLALDAAMACLQKETAVGQSSEVVLNDGSRRATLATSSATDSSHLKEEAWPEWVQDHCPGFVHAATALSIVVGVAVDTLAFAADALLGPSSTQLHPLVQKGKHLEHFHRYEVSVSNVSARALAGTHGSPHAPATLSLHTDAGLLLAMSPGLWKTESASSSSTTAEEPPVLEVELQDGRRMPLVSSKGNLLVLVGQGLADWLPSHGFRPVRHALRLSRAATAASTRSATLIRAWYGRMIFPPADFSLGRGMTFGQWHSRARGLMQSSVGADVSGGEDRRRSSLRHGESNSSSIDAHMVDPNENVAGCWSWQSMQERLVDLAGTCRAGEVFCWLQCRSVKELPCGETAVCVDLQSGDPCPTNRSAGCQPICRISHATTPALVVSNAGIQHVNGQYAVATAGIATERPAYHQVGGSVRLAWIGHLGEWRFYDPTDEDGKVLYWCGMDIDEPSKCLWIVGAESGESGLGLTVSRVGAEEEARFCNGMMGMAQRMGGFVSLASEMRSQQSCLVIFFSAWKLDSGMMFVFGLLGAVFMGMCSEAILRLRFVNPVQRSRRRRTLAGFGKVLRYLLYRALVFFTMLLAMTYQVGTASICTALAGVTVQTLDQVEMFVAVLLGLTLGHAIFNLPRSRRESGDTMDMEDCNCTVLEADGTVDLVESDIRRQASRSLRSSSISQQC